MAASAAGFQVDWRGLPADAGLVPAGKLALPIKFVLWLSRLISSR